VRSLRARAPDHQTRPRRARSCGRWEVSTHWSDFLTSLHACDEAIEWARTQPDAATAWQKCKRADWMLWIAAKILPRPVVVQACCDCAETAWEYCDGATLLQSMLTIHIVREWAEGREDLETLHVARQAAYATAYADYGAATTADAAYAAATTAAAATATAYAAEVTTGYTATFAADAATAYADYGAATAAAYAATFAADAATARKEALKQMAALVCRRIPASMIVAAAADADDAEKSKK
jgi:hypothetical protein